MASSSHHHRTRIYRVPITVIGHRCIYRVIRIIKNIESQTKKVWLLSMSFSKNSPGSVTRKSFGSEFHTDGPAYVKACLTWYVTAAERSPTTTKIKDCKFIRNADVHCMTEPPSLSSPTKSRYLSLFGCVACMDWKADVNQIDHTGVQEKTTCSTGSGISQMTWPPLTRGCWRLETVRVDLSGGCWLRIVLCTHLGECWYWIA